MSSDARKVTDITPITGISLPGIREPWNFRELLFFLTLRDIKVRYKQTALGATWLFIQPLGMLLAFTLIFGRLANMPSDGLPYPLFAIVGLLPWQLFSRSLTSTTTSLVRNQQLISRVYFPRILIPLSSLLAAFFDFFITSLLVIIMLIYYGAAPDWHLVAILPLIILLFLTAFGVGLIMASLILEYRDIGHTVGFLAQMWLFFTPVVYPASVVPQKYEVVYALNPMVGVVEGFRWAILGTGSAPGLSIAISGSVTLALLGLGLVFFRWRERSFADAIGSGGR